MTDQATATPGTDTAAPATTQPAAVTETPATATAPAVTSEAPKDTGTLLSDGAAPAATAPTADPASADGAAPKTEPEVAPDWPADWREKGAAGDTKKLERLGRFNSPLDIINSYFELEKEFKSGKVRKEEPFPTDGSPEQQAAWRKERGIPDDFAGYKPAFPEGFVPAEADKPLLEEFSKVAHQNNWTQETYNQAVGWYFAEQQKQAQLRAEADAEYQRASDDELRRELGGEYRPVLNGVKNLLAGMPEGAADNLLNGRFSDGTKIGDNPGFIKWLAGVQRELNPMATLVPAGTSDPGKSINDEIASIEKLMKDQYSDYWRGPKAEATQQRYRDLIQAREKSSARAA